MAQSTTRKKQEAEINSLFLNIKEFAMSELFDLLKRTGEDTIIYAITDSNIVVGRFSVVLDSGVWRVSNYFDEILHKFHHKSSAVYYALAMMQQRFGIADRLKAADHGFQNARNEFSVYDSKVREQMQEADEFKLHLYLCKLEESRIRLRNSVSEMEKSLRTAKYLNNSGT